MTRIATTQQALLRARELCLLGNYDKGIVEFRAVQKKLNVQLGIVPEAQEFLQDLQREYDTLSKYRRTIQSLAIVALKVQKAQEHSEPVKVRRQRRRQEERSAKVLAIDEDSNATKKPLQTGTTRKSAASRRRERKVMPWLQREELRANSSARTRQRNDSQRTAKRSTKRSSFESENKVYNGARCCGIPSNADKKQRKTKSRLLSSKRRESYQSTTDSNSSMSHQECSLGKSKYSELAKKNGWVDHELIEAIERDIIHQGEIATFEMIAGLEHTKQLLQETVMLPQIAPHLFTDGLLKPCRGVLLFGPPGTGKTLLAKAVAHECKSTFFNVSASTLSSKYRGDSEKMVRILFDMARYYEPSIIFMDEIDAIASSRGTATEHETSRRVKAELLTQINGISSGMNVNSRVMLLAATNLPWDLDEAMRRRLTKRVYVPLPETEARRALFELNLRHIDVDPDVTLDELVQRTEGYSGDDITNVCETAKRMPVKRVYTPKLLVKMHREMEAGKKLDELETERLVVTKADFADALRNVSKSVGHNQLQRFEEWEAEFGSK